METPDSIKKFRKILNHVKRSLLDNQDVYEDTENIQNVEKIHEITDRIQQFGNIVLSLLEDSDADTKEHKSVKTLFHKYKFMIPSRNTREHKLCVHYLKNDVFCYPYDLNPSHMDVLEKS